MRSISHRLAVIEQTVGDENCTCGEHRQACVLVEEGWMAAALFVCPTHGAQMPALLVRLSSVDMSL